MYEEKGTTISYHRCKVKTFHLFVFCTSVTDPYSSNPDPDPAKNRNPDPDPERPWIRIRILAISLHYLKKT